MYQAFYQLTQMPFTLTPNTALFFNQRSHREALNTLLVALKHREGFIKVVGEVGTGKTILCRKLLAILQDRVLTAYIPNPYLNPEELKSVLAEEIGVPDNGQVPPHKLLSVIYRRLIELAQEGRQVVLVIDEAQAMPRETIEALRLLTNLETERHKLLQVVLFGQPELDVLLNRPDLRQLKQRIVFSEYLKPYDHTATVAYIKHRLQAAGVDRPLFSAMALRLLSWTSRGVPRLINILAHKGLLAAYGQGKTIVGGGHILRAVIDTEESRWLFSGNLFSANNRRILWSAVGGLLLAGLMLAGLWPGGGA